jgi:hypothetical protein
MANITLLPENNYQMDTRTPAIKFFNNIANDVKGLKTNTGTNPVSFSLPFTKLMPIFQTGVGGFLGNWQTYTQGIYDLYFGTGRSFEGYKLNFVNDIVLSVILGISPLNIPNNIPNYSFPIYLNLFKTLQNESGSIFEPFLLTPLGVINWTTTNGFSCDINQNYRLSDVIQSRRFDTTYGYSDFSNTNDQNSNDKITSDQYNKLINEANTFVANITYDDTALSPAQITHLNTNLGTASGSPSGFGSYALNLSLIFTYFGLTANYIPI